MERDGVGYFWWVRWVLSGSERNLSQLSAGHAGHHHRTDGDATLPVRWGGSVQHDEQHDPTVQHHHNQQHYYPTVQHHQHDDDPRAEPMQPVPVRMLPLHMVWFRLDTA